MLFVYARHTPDCDHRDDPKYRRCRCPKWTDGYVDNLRLRQSAKTRSWEKAELTARSIQEAADRMKAAQPVITTIEDAIDAYVVDEKGRNLSKETTKQSKTLFEKQLLPWAKHRGLIRPRDLTAPELVNFRATWGNNGLTANRKLSRLAGFFAFCIHAGGQCRCKARPKRGYLGAFSEGQSHWKTCVQLGTALACSWSQFFVLRRRWV